MREPGKVGCCQPIGTSKFQQPFADRSGSNGRDLLGNDGADQHSEAVLFETQGVRPHGIDHGPHHRIGSPKMTAGGLDVGWCQLHGLTELFVRSRSQCLETPFGVGRNRDHHIALLLLLFLNLL